MNAATGHLTGTAPSAAAAQALGIVIQATDLAGASATGSFTLNVNAAATSGGGSCDDSGKDDSSKDDNHDDAHETDHNVGSNGHATQQDDTCKDDMQDSHSGDAQQQQQTRKVASVGLPFQRGAVADDLGFVTPAVILKQGIFAGAAGSMARGTGKGFGNETRALAVDDTAAGLKFVTLAALGNALHPDAVAGGSTLPNNRWAVMEGALLAHLDGTGYTSAGGDLAWQGGAPGDVSAATALLAGAGRAAGTKVLLVEAAMQRAIG
jgi:hypothetical protein